MMIVFSRFFRELTPFPYRALSFSNLDVTKNVYFTLMLPWVPEAFHARFPVSVKKVTRFAARVFGRRPKMCWPAADEASLRTREKNLWYPG